MIPQLRKQLADNTKKLGSYPKENTTKITAPKKTKGIGTPTNSRTISNMSAIAIVI
jgi:hypothetical protein